MVYKVLLFFLSLSSIFFGLSHLMIKGNNIKFIVLSFMAIFIIFILIGMLVKKIYIQDGIIYSKTLAGTKKIDLSTLCGVSVIDMKGRVLCILSDEDHYLFISSMFDGFMDIINNIKDLSPIESTEQLNALNDNDMNKKAKLITGFLIFANLFLIGLSIYNII